MTEKALLLRFICLDDRGEMPLLQSEHVRLGLLALDSTPGHLHQRNSMDWTTRAPGVRMPFDERALAMTSAGFPLGEPLSVAAIAQAHPAAPATQKGPALGVSTGSASTAGDAPKTPGIE